MLNDNSIFSDEIRDSFILHIPHSSLNIPSYVGYSDRGLLDNEIIKTTDHKTDIIFDVDGVDKLIADFNRCFCDVERLDDNDEELYQQGKGFYYTKTDCDKPLRTEENKIHVYENYYLKHHKRLSNLVVGKLKQHNVVRIVDCHSFNDEPLLKDFNKYSNRPDICIGVCDYHTPKYLQDYFVNFFKKMGYSVLINNPYSGTIVPIEYYRENKNVESIMVEINKKIYMDGDSINMNSVFYLKEKINELFNNI